MAEPGAGMVALCPATVQLGQPLGVAVVLLSRVEWHAELSAARDTAAVTAIVGTAEPPLAEIAAEHAHCDACTPGSVHHGDLLHGLCGDAAPQANSMANPLQGVSNAFDGFAGAQSSIGCWPVTAESLGTVPADEAVQAPAHPGMMTAGGWPQPQRCGVARLDHAAASCVTIRQLEPPHSSVAACTEAPAVSHECMAALPALKAECGANPPWDCDSAFAAAQEAVWTEQSSHKREQSCAAVADDKSCRPVPAKASMPLPADDLAPAPVASNGSPTALPPAPIGAPLLVVQGKAAQDNPAAQRPTARARTRIGSEGALTTLHQEAPRACDVAHLTGGGTAGASPPAQQLRVPPQRRKRDRGSDVDYDAHLHVAEQSDSAGSASPDIERSSADGDESRPPAIRAQAAVCAKQPAGGVARANACDSGLERKRARVELPEEVELAEDERWCGVCARVVGVAAVPIAAYHEARVVRCKGCLALLAKGKRYGQPQADVIDAIRDGSVDELFAGQTNRLLRRDKHRNAGLDTEAEQRCGLCDAVKPLDDFHVNRVRSTGRNLLCKVCQQIAQRGHRLGLRLAELRAHVAAGTLNDVEGLMLPHLARALDAHRDAADLDEPPAGQKRCVQCLEVKSQDEFSVNAACAAEGGRGSFCRPCWQIRFNARSRNMTLDDVRALVAAAAPAEAADVAEREREVRFCAQLKPLNDFNRKKAHKDGYDTWCRPCATLKLRAFKLKPSVGTAQLQKALREGRILRIPGLAVPEGVVPNNAGR